MRAPYNVLILPYIIENDILFVCLLKRSDLNCWQFPCGGGEENETPLQAAARELSEESGIVNTTLLELKAKYMIPVELISGFNGGRIFI